MVCESRHQSEIGPEEVEEAVVLRIDSQRKSGDYREAIETI